MNPKTYLSVEDVAERLAVNTTTVYRLVQRGDLPGFKVGGLWRFSLEMLDEWVADRVTIQRLKGRDSRENHSEKEALVRNTPRRKIRGK